MLYYIADGLLLVVVGSGGGGGSHKEDLVPVTTWLLLSMVVWLVLMSPLLYMIIIQRTGTTTTTRPVHTGHHPSSLLQRAISIYDGTVLNDGVIATGRRLSSSSSSSSIDVVTHAVDPSSKDKDGLFFTIDNHPPPTGAGEVRERTESG